MPENPDPMDEPEVSPEELGEDGVLSPDDLDVSDREEVSELDDGRFVVSTEAGRSPSPRRPSPTLDADDSPTPPETPESAPAEQSLSAIPERYATAIAAKTDSGVADEQFASNNIVDTFERTLRWYASRIDPEEPPEDVLRVLLAESDLDV